MIPYNQLSLADIFSDCQEIYESDKPQFLSLLQQHIDLDQIVPAHFCYAYKFGIVTNGLGIVRSISFYNKEFFDKHPEIIVNKKSDSPDEDKSVHDARLLIPTLQDLFAAHPLLNPHTFLGDADFDSAKLYNELLSGSTFGTDADGNGMHFQKAYIPLNSRAGLENKDYSVNHDGIPCCPNDQSLPLKPESTSKLRSGISATNSAAESKMGKRPFHREIPPCLPL